MRILKLFYRQFIKYSLLFGIIAFLVSSIFVCHIYTVGAADLNHNFVQDSQPLSGDFHGSSGSCHNRKESLLSQSEFDFFLTSNKVQGQNNQKFAPDFNSITSEGLSNLVPQKDTLFISSDNLNDSQTAQLLIVVKIE